MIKLLLGLAEDLYAHLRFEDAYIVTSRIMELSPDHQGALPLHIGAMFHIKRLHPALFILAHRLVESDPESPCSWYAIGAWYAGSGRWTESRRYFRCVQRTLVDVWRTELISRGKLQQGVAPRSSLCASMDRLRPQLLFPRRIRPSGHRLQHSCSEISRIPSPESVHRHGARAPGKLSPSQAVLGRKRTTYARRPSVFERARGSRLQTLRVSVDPCLMRQSFD